MDLYLRILLVGILLAVLAVNRDYLESRGFSGINIDVKAELFLSHQSQAHIHYYLRHQCLANV